MTFSDVKLSDLINNINIENIGSFFVGSKVVIGDTDYEELNLKPGTYTAYYLAESLMIINDDLNINPNKNTIGTWTWTHSGKGVGVDSGMFGFYDIDTLRKINKDNVEKHKNIPMFELPKDYDFTIDAFLVDGSLISKEDIDRDPSLKNLKPFGVQASTTTGDGGFECFVINNDRAILLGGDANIALYGDEN